VVTAIVWRFGQYYRKETAIEEARYPKLAAHSERAEKLPQFASTPID
jgi:hypothetical protein